MSSPDPGPQLLGRHTECAALDELVASVRAGPSRTLVMRGECGVGKSALLDYLARRATGCTVARAAGVEAEAEIAYAGLHQLCAPFADHLEQLPEPQRDALATVFGRRGGAAPDRLLVGLAVLSLLSEVAEERPLVAIVDDAQWLDGASAQALAFVARRLGVESVGLVLSVREPAPERDFEGLPEMVVRGLDDRDARALLETVITGPLDERVRERIVAETAGNPLALLELPRGRTPAELAGGFGLDGPPALERRVEQRFQEHLAELPPDTQQLLLIAAAEPVGDPLLLWRAATALGVGGEAAAPATSAGLVEIGADVHFRHPLIRSAVYDGAAPEQRRRVHRALADATDADLDPDRRAWHRAQAAAGLDEEVAAELERSAGRARDRAGLAAGAAFHERAAELTPDPARRAHRALAAAQAKHQAGAPKAALHLLAAAQAGPLDELAQARAQLLQAEITFTTTRGSDAPPLLLAAAKRLERLDPALARRTYLEAFAAALSADRLARGGDAGEVAAAVLAAELEPPTRAPDILLDGLAALFAQGRAMAAPALKQALRAFREEPMTEDEELRWLWLACHVARDMCDDEAWDELTARQLELARRTGAFSMLLAALNDRFTVELLSGHMAVAKTLAGEADAVADATGIHLTGRAQIALASWRGDAETARALTEARRQDVTGRGEGLWLAANDWGAAVLYNALGRYEDALAAVAGMDGRGMWIWVASEFIEAAVRTGHPERAAEPLARLTEIAAANGTDWALGLLASRAAMLADGEAAERLYREALERLSRTRIRVGVARGHLHYGEWLRRENRRVDAREQLRLAHEMFVEIGYEPFAERARRELLATGETVRKRTVETLDDLTPQETQIGRMAADGFTNPEIGAQLFLSPRTVEWHLRKVFGKLGITSRRELRTAMPGARGAVVAA